MFLTVISSVLVIILIVFLLIIKDVNKGKYNVKESDGSALSKEAEEKYLKQFPNYTIKDLKLEIEKIADILVDNQESNRYTEVLRQKAKNDDKIKRLKDTVIQDVDIMKYNRGILKAKVKYKDFENEYSLVLNMNTVTRGRVFLNNYYVFKEQ